VSPRRNAFRIGDEVDYEGRRYEVFGFTPMSVTPARMLLEEAATGRLVGVELADLELVRPAADDAARAALRRVEGRR
jgi:hypothetical protein